MGQILKFPGAKRQSAPEPEDVMNPDAPQRGVPQVGLARGSDFVEFILPHLTLKPATNDEPSCKEKS